MKPSKEGAHSIDEVTCQFLNGQGALIEKPNTYICFEPLWFAFYNLQDKKPVAVRYFPQWSKVSKQCLETFYYDLMGTNFFFGKCVLNMDTLIKDEFVEVSLIDAKNYGIFEFLSTLIMCRYPDEGHLIVNHWMKDSKDHSGKKGWIEFFKAHHSAGAYANSNHLLWSGDKTSPQFSQISPNRSDKYPTIMECFKSGKRPLISSRWRNHAPAE